MNGANVTCIFIVLISMYFSSSVFAGSLGGKTSELYDSKDKLVILNNATFNSKVYGKTSVWLVEFYNSWCGFCQRFAPTWKEFAESVHVWQDVTTIGVVDCANFDNNPLCRNLEIMAYPTLRVFPPLSKPGSLGVDLKAEKTVTGIRHGLLDYLEKEQLEGKGSPLWPNITPYRSSEQNNVWKNVPSAVEFTFLIFEETSSSMGKEVILDYHKVSNAQVRRVTTNNEAFAKLMEISNFPSLAVIKRDMSVVHLMPKAKTRGSYAAAIHAFLVQNGGIEDANSVREIPREEDLHGKSQKLEAMEKEHIPDVVYRVDLENTLRYSLKHEIAMHKIISGDSLVALQSYLRALASFFPTKPQGTMFLERLRDWVLARDDDIKGDDFLNKVNELEKNLDFKIEPKDWIGCKGSHHRYRGYTCGLWTMFHTLTVGAASQNKKRLTPGSDNVLKSILQYVKFFFGCDGCSKHFQQMAADRNLESITGTSESVLWLWEAHNVVNQRLKGDITEDPEHPKIQFPSIDSCSNCKLGNEHWDKTQILSYLKERFNKNNICQHDKNSIGLCKPLITKETIDVVVSNANPTLSAFQDVVTLSGWDFNVADISLCVFLYACSAIILILVYIKFVVRRGYRKKYNFN